MGDTAVEEKGESGLEETTDAIAEEAVTGGENQDLIGRLATLVVLLVTTINTVLDAVSSFVDEVYWRFGLSLGFLVFIHVPCIATMIYFIIKASVKKVVKKVRPKRKGRVGDVTEVKEIPEKTREAKDKKKGKKEQGTELVHKLQKFNKGFEEGP